MKNEEDKKKPQDNNPVAVLKIRYNQVRIYFHDWDALLLVLIEVEVEPQVVLGVFKKNNRRHHLNHRHTCKNLHN